MEEREKDLLEKQRQFEIRMKEQQERFLKDKKGYEAAYQKRVDDLTIKEDAVEKAKNHTNVSIIYFCLMFLFRMPVLM